MKYLKITVISVLIISIFCILYIVTEEPSITRKSGLKKLREANSIVANYKSNKVQIDDKQEFIDIIARGEKKKVFVNLPTDKEHVEIVFYNKNKEIIYTLKYYLKENEKYFIGSNGPEVQILEKDRDKFHMMLGISEE